MSRETDLWYWLLFDAGWPTQRAKALLAQITAADLTLERVCADLPRIPQALNLTNREAAGLHPPAQLPPITALRWNETLYPAGLRQLPQQRRPALLFYRGERALLARPLVHLLPAPVAEDDEDTLRETIALLLGESLLPAAVRGSKQAALLLAEMADLVGETLLFVRSGLETAAFTENERALLEAGRLILLSPLPPATPASPRWANALAQVETAAASRCVHVGAQPPETLQPITTPVLWIHSGDAQSEIPAEVPQVPHPTDMLTWLATAGSPPPTAPPPSPREPERKPPPTPEETLNILERGGRIPDVLRKRLLGK